MTFKPDIFESRQEKLKLLTLSYAVRNFLTVDTEKKQFLKCVSYLFAIKFEWSKTKCCWYCRVPLGRPKSSKSLRKRDALHLRSETHFNTDVCLWRYMAIPSISTSTILICLCQGREFFSKDNIHGKLQTTDHGTLGNTDFMRTITICTRWVFGGIWNRTRGFRSESRYHNH